ncbi:MAG TPA: alpha/beta hydrolase [Candidatus Dormibacteraeota bacterium]|nr:alpha/beta hydrolase [Candidatus Dormibacteraeota bacterium]
MGQPADGWFERDGVDLHFLEWNREAGHEASAVLLLHGLSSNAHYWDRLASRLTQMRLVALDQRAHGLTGREPHAPRLPEGLAMEELVGDAVAVIRERELARPLVVGHSWGATVGLELAGRHSDLVSGLVFIDGPIQSAANLFSWEEAQGFMQPPLPRYSTFAEAVADSRRDFDGAWAEDLEPFVLSRLMQSGTEFVLTLTSEARLELLRGLYDSPVDQLWDDLESPALAMLARGGPSRMADSRAAGARRLAASNPSVRVRWFDTPHDIPLFAPDEVAEEVRRVAAEARPVGSEAAVGNELEG